MHLTDPYIRERAKSMRRHPTASEAKLWSWLRMRRFGRFKFRRQHPIGPCIVDFYCAELKLAIEVDGAQHATPAVAEIDGARERILRGYGVTVVRIANRVIATDPVTAAQTVEWAIDRAAQRTQVKSARG